jgi:hypothetical protein
VPITHPNVKRQTFALYQGTTKTGKPRYYFAMQSEGPLAKAIPAGYEIYENPNAQVFLRRIPPKIITDEERRAVEEGMRTYATVKDYKIDIKGNAILIYTAIQEIDALADLFKDLYPDPTANVELMANAAPFRPNAIASSGRWMTGSRLASRGSCLHWLNGMSSISARIHT